MDYVTLVFPDRPTAVFIAKQLGFWDENGSRLFAEGQTFAEDGRTVFSWMIDEIGEVLAEPRSIDPQTGLPTPAVYRPGYYVNACGVVPTEVMQFSAPYGTGGRLFQGTEATQ